MFTNFLFSQLILTQFSCMLPNTLEQRRIWPQINSNTLQIQTLINKQGSVVNFGKKQLYDEKWVWIYIPLLFFVNSNSFYCFTRRPRYICSCFRNRSLFSKFLGDYSIKDSILLIIEMEIIELNPWSSPLPHRLRESLCGSTTVACSNY